MLLHILCLCILALAVVKYAEEIQDLKENVYNRITLELAPGTADPSDATVPADTTAPETVAEAAKESITLYPANVTGEEWFADAPIIYHAGGTVQGITYTNSREAIEKSLEEGHFFIEVDFSHTSDGHLVCAHAWTDLYLTDYQPTLEEFVSSRVQGRFTPLTAAELIQIMKNNPQMYVITDTKDDDIAPMVSNLVALAENDPAILDRFIILLYFGREKSSIQEIYPFQDSQFLFTMYKWGPWHLKAVRICNEENISVITTTADKIPDEDVAMLRELGFTLYEHTINRVDLAKHSRERGISSFYTDYLSPEDIVP